MLIMISKNIYANLTIVKSHAKEKVLKKVIFSIV